jgi:hypothetical protein
MLLLGELALPACGVQQQACRGAIGVPRSRVTRITIDGLATPQDFSRFRWPTGYKIPDRTRHLQIGSEPVEIPYRLRGVDLLRSVAILIGAELAFGVGGVQQAARIYPVEISRAHAAGYCLGHRRIVVLSGLNGLMIECTGAYI